jgi:uncharacterized protein (TIGR03067 family)
MRKMLLVVAAVSSLAAADNSEKDTSRAIQEIPWPSEWTGFAIEKDSMEVKECTFEFLNAGALKITHDNESESGFYRLDLEAVPPRIDLRQDVESEPDIFGIYGLGNDTLKICVSRDAESRPSEFNTQDSKGGEVLVRLKRKRP